jgi:hypothetical protein
MHVHCSAAAHTTAPAPGETERGYCADTRAAVLFALSGYAKAGFNGTTKSKAVNRLAASLDATALDAYAAELISAFASGKLRLDEGALAMLPRSGVLYS